MWCACVCARACQINVCTCNVALFPGLHSDFISAVEKNWQRGLHGNEARCNVQCIHMQYCAGDTMVHDCMNLS